MTTTSYHGGSDWSEVKIYDGWGECGDNTDCESVYQMLGDMVIDKFHEIVKKNNSTATWIPQTAEVIHDINESIELIEQYETWRNDAIESIGEQWINGEIYD